MVFAAVVFETLDDIVIIRSSTGMYRQCKLALLGAGLYAAVGNSFVRLYNNGGTSNPKLTWVNLEGLPRYEKDAHGRLFLDR